MKLYLVSRTDQIGYDEFDSFICCALTPKDAKNMHPSGLEENWRNSAPRFWTTQKFLKCELIGYAKLGTPIGVILSSFNSG